MSEMSRVYAISIEEPVNLIEMNYLLAVLSKEKQELIRSFRFRDDAIRSIIGEVFVRTQIVQQYGIKNEEIMIEKNEYGKPFVKDMEGYHYNISHSGKWVVCAIDSQPVGIDVEQTNPIDLDIARRFFAQEEVKDLLMKCEDERTSYFYDLWSLKESYIKMIGKGLSIPLDSFICKIDENQIYFKSGTRVKPVYFKKYDIDLDLDVRVALCQNHPRFSETITLKTIKEMINFVKNHSLFRMKVPY